MLARSQITKSFLNRQVLFSLTSVSKFSSTSSAYAKKSDSDITRIPLKHLGVMAPYYIPPPIFSSPFSLWHKLVLRRWGQFFYNTYSIYKFKSDTGKAPKFEAWKDQAIAIFIKTNKAFAEKKTQLLIDETVGVQTFNSLRERSETIPKHTKLEWELVKIEENPKVVSFNALPDPNGVTGMIQFVMKLRSTQRVTVKSVGSEPTSTERTSTDYLVYSLDPYSDEMCLVGSLFECDHLRPIQPDLESVSNYKQMVAFQKECADIFREKPKSNN